MPSVWLSRFSKWIEALNNAKGGAVLYDVDPSLKAVALIMEGNEDRYLQGWGRYAISQSITGGPGQNAAVQLRNPLGSNVVAVVERISVAIGPATQSSFNLSLTPGPAGIADLTTIVQALKTDGRQNQNSSLIFSTSTNAVGFSNVIQLGRVNNGSNFQFFQTVNQELPLLPGSAIIVLDLTVAELAQFEMHWRERPLQSSELT